MNVTVTTRHINDRQTNKILKDYALRKVNRLERYINEDKDPSQVKFTLSEEKFRNIAEIHVNDGRTKVNASVEMDDMHAAIDGVLDIVIKQLRRKSDKMIRTKRRSNSRPSEQIQKEYKESEENITDDIVSEKLNSKPMSLEEARLQLNVADKGFVVFRNIETDELNVIYTKNNSKVGLISP